MNAACGRRLGGTPAGGAESQAEVHVLAVGEQPLVEAADRAERAPAVRRGAAARHRAAGPALAQGRGAAGCTRRASRRARCRSRRPPAARDRRESGDHPDGRIRERRERSRRRTPGSTHNVVVDEHDRVACRPPRRPRSRRGRSRRSRSSSTSTARRDTARAPSREVPSSDALSTTMTRAGVAGAQRAPGTREQRSPGVHVETIDVGDHRRAHARRPRAGARRRRDCE